MPFGFNNTYALAMSEARAKSLGIARISDLASAQGGALKLGLSHEFLQRADGWPALRQAYALTPTPIGLDHGLAYDAVAAGKVDVIDVYSTDAKLGRLGLRVLEDDRAFFPKYDAVLLMRASVDAGPLQRLAGSIDAATMIAMNGEVELDGRSFAETAARFLAARGVAAAAGGAAGGERAAAAGAAQAGPLGAPVRARSRPARRRAPAAGVRLARRSPWRWACRSASPPGAGRGAAGVLLGVVAILQTVPSLALLAFLIALVGSIGVVPALIALFLYALLPIVRNTHAGLQGVSREMAQAALSLGLTPRQALRAGAAAAGGADDPRRHQDRGGDQRRHGDDGRVHRRRRLRRAHRRRARRQRQHRHARRRGAGGGAGAASSRSASISPSAGPAAGASPAGTERGRRRPRRRRRPAATIGGCLSNG